MTTLLLFLACSIPSQAQVSAEERKEGFRPLFNGRSLDGWDGELIQIRVNGLLTAELRDTARMEGVIALQVHRGPPMEVYFRNLRLKVLP